MEAHKTKNFDNTKKSPSIYDGPAFKAARLIFKFLCKWMPKSAAYLAAKIFSRPRRFRRPAREEHVLKSAQPFTVQTKHGKIAAWQWGSGPTILCIHGWEGRGTQFHGFVKPLVDSGYRVVVYDGPAHGDSDGNQTNLIHFVEATKELLQVVGVIHGIIAHSFGGAVATLLLKSGVQATKATFFAAPNDMIEITENFGTILGLTPAVLHNMRDDFLHRYQGDWKPYAQAWEDLELAKMAKEISLPLLLLHDEDDKAVKMNNSITLNNAWENANLVQTKGLGHQRILRDPDIISQVLGFITKTHETEPALN
ncbi:MAG: alpha/beta fold hydrolase [Calditrichaeota bacterium]|nr:MAG: alpha/beta fold hydrolase [Calditrichota bacterium]